MLLQALFSLLLATVATANGGVNCGAFNTIVSIMHEGAVVTPYCSSYLGISQVTTTLTQTSTPSALTTTTTISSTNTVTTTSVSTVSGTTTVYPVVAVSTTSTCSPAANNKRDVTTASTLPVPIALTAFVQTDRSSACKCLGLATPTQAIVTTTTLPTSTVTSTAASTAQTTVTEYSTTTTFTATYFGTQYYTNTYTVLAPPSSTIIASVAPSQTFGAYAQDFSGYDIESFNCYPNGPPLPAKYSSTQCNNFVDCVNECAYYNAQGFGALSNTTCGAALYNSPGDGSSGYCYLKTQVHGCGSPNKMTNTGVLLPLVAST